jgi:two-component system, chemotaxis family, response regulator Rcp1
MRVLLVEDNPGDVGLVEEGLADSPLRVELAVAKDGVEAMEYLRAYREGEPSGMPNLIILDLNLPRRSGRQVLADIRRDAEMCLIPVVILTSSEAETDVAECYQLGANCYLTKPIDLSMYLSVVRGIESFWLRLAALPRLGSAEGSEGVAR